MTKTAKKQCKLIRNVADVVDASYILLTHSSCLCPQPLRASVGGFVPEGILWPLESARPILRRRQCHPTPVLLPGKSHGRRNLVGSSPWGREESGTTERLHFHPLAAHTFTIVPPTFILASFIPLNPLTDSKLTFSNSSLVTHS